MSLLNRVANREVFDFLRTVTIKSNYFANKTRALQIRPNIEKLVTETANPYTIRLAGEYLIDNKSIEYRQFDIDMKKSLQERTYALSEMDPESEEYVIADEELKLDKLKWRFPGYRRTIDTVPSFFKNYWKLTASGAGLARVPRSEYIDSFTGQPKEEVNPSDMLWYEIRPYIFKDVPDPIGGTLRNIELPISQLIFDNDGRISDEMKNDEIYVDGIYDTVMTVTSLDVTKYNPETGKHEPVTIPFCLQTLHEEYAPNHDSNRVHTKTLEAYRLPGKYFDDLCKRYPNQVDLIKAIVYPVKSVKISSIVTLPELKKRLDSYKSGDTVAKLATDEYIADIKRRYPNKYDFIRKMGKDIEGYRIFDPSNRTYTPDENYARSEARRNRIVKAKNFELLAYDFDRLDETEQTSLLEYTQEFLNIVNRRWAIDEYNFEENYAATLWTLLWSLLPVALIAKRYANIKTPYVSEQHMWDYLASKGLGDYKGYLTTDQTLFMYKNILYLLQHAGQQKTLNILIDNILSKYGLTLKAKTVVLDTSDSLKKTDRPATPSLQCQSCSRYKVSCFKNITEHMCDEWLGTTTLCKAMPIVLTEDFAGASKDKVVRALMKSYGLSEADAIKKYRRSFIWKDADVEAIKDDLNRDQLVDMNGRLNTLDETIYSEHIGGQEPVYSGDIVDEQQKELRHMNGTVAPTKLLELTRQQYNAKFSELFNRFVTETLLRLAPTTDAATGNRIHRVTCSYEFSTTEGAASFRFDYGEMLAASYLGFVREYLVDTLIDKVERGEWTQERLTDVMYNFTYKFPIPSSCRTTTTFKFGTPVLQEELVSEYINNPNPSTDLPVEPHSYVGDGTPVIVSLNNDKPSKHKLYLVVETDDDPNGFWEDYGIIRNGKPLCLKIVGSYEKGFEYVEGSNPREIWKFYPNTDDEIPLIPKFFRWYYPHLNPNIGEKDTWTDEERREKETDIPLAKRLTQGGYVANEVNAKPDDDLNMGFDPNSEGEPRRVQSGKMYKDMDKSKTFRIFHLKQFLDVDELINRWIAVPRVIKEQRDLTNYIDTMFEILEDIYCFASQSCSVRTCLACRTFLDCVLSQKIIEFDLTGTDRKYTLKYPLHPEDPKCAYFSDWIQKDKDVYGAFKIIDNMKDSDLGWNEFNTSVIQKLLEGSNIPYAKNIITDLQYKKLKQLVLSLSSYRITIMEEDELGRVCNEIACPVEDALLDQLEINEIIYFYPIWDSEWAPRVGGYTGELHIATKDQLVSRCIDCGSIEFSDGDIMVLTRDLRFNASKQYFALTTGDSSAYDEHDPNQPIKLKKRPLGHVATGAEGSVIGDPTTGAPVEMINIPRMTRFVPGTDLEDGDRLEPGKYYEKINLYDILEVEPGTPLLIMRDEKWDWYYCTGTVVEDSVKYPSGNTGQERLKTELLDVETTDDKFDLRNEFSNPATARDFPSPVYRINANFETVEWSDPIKSKVLERHLYPTVNHEFVLTESTEPNILMEESEYPVTNNEEDNT